MSDTETTPAPPDAFEGAVSLADAAASYGEVMDGGPDAEETESAETTEADAEETAEGTEEGAEDATEDAETETEETSTLETLSDLAEQLDVPVDELASTLKHTFKAAGEERTATLAELVEGFQLRADYDRSKTTLAQTRTRLDRENTERLEKFDAQFDSLAARLTGVDVMLEAEFSGPELAALREVNPAEWAARVQENRQKRADLDRTWNEAVNQRTTAREEEVQDFFKREGKILEADVDGWGEEKLNTALDIIRGLGFEDKDMHRVMDHRLIKGALEVSSLRAENKTLKDRLASGAKAAKQVKRTVPKMAKPGAPKAQVNVKSESLQKAQAAFKRNPSVRNAARLYELEGDA